MMKMRKPALGLLAVLAVLGADDRDQERVLVNLYPTPDGGFVCPLEECDWRTGICCEVTVPEDWKGLINA